MATYITLMNFTGQGLDALKQAESFKEAAERLGLIVKDMYWTFGAYDIVTTVEAEDETAVSSLSTAIGAMDGVHTHTLHAFGPEEMQQILSKLG